MAVTVRRATADDLEAAGRLTVDAYVCDGLIDRDDVYADFLADAAARDRDGEVWVALDESGRVVGTVTYVEPGSPLAEVSQPGEAEMRSLAVAPTGRGRGIGELLARHCLDLARQRHAHTFVLSSATTMQAAHRLYGRLGFVRDPDRDWVPVPGRQLWAFSKALSPD